MDGLLFESSQGWDKRNAAASCAGEKEKFRVLEAHRGSVEEKFASRILAFVSDPNAWLALPDTSATPRIRSLALRMCSRAIGAMEVLTRKQKTGFPWLLFTVLEGHAADVFKECPQKRDDFSHDWLKEFFDTSHSWVSRKHCVLKHNRRESPRLC